MGCHSEVLGMCCLHRPSPGMIALLQAVVKKCAREATATSAVSHNALSGRLDQWRDIRVRPWAAFKLLCVRP